MRVTIAAILAVAACAAARTATSHSAIQAVAIDTMRLREVTRRLADDALAGRETGSAGAARARAYIAGVCREIGLSPIGTDYELPVPLARSGVEGGSVRLDNGGAAATFRSFHPMGITPTTVRNFGGRMLFVGDDDAARALGEVTLDGAVAVLAGMLPQTAVADSLAAKGAVGIIMLAPESTPAFFRGLRGVPPLMLDAPIESSFYPNLPAIALWGAVDTLMALATPSQGSAPPIDIGITAEVTLPFRPQPVDGANVGCQLAGTDPQARDTAIALTAHLDHLGVAGTPEMNGDSIYNGFSDNAAGVAMLLAIGEALAASGGLRHSLLLLFFTGEEKGLIGSDYYVARPAWPLERTLAVINLDAGAPPARPSSWRLAGGDTGPLGAVARAVAAERGWTAATSPATPNSDYYPFWRECVPSVFIVPGPGPYEGLTADSSDALRARWDRYHQADDEYDDAFPFEGVARYADFARAIVRAVDRTGLPGR